MNFQRTVRSLLSRSVVPETLYVKLIKSNRPLSNYYTWKQTIRILGKLVLNRSSPRNLLLIDYESYVRKLTTNNLISFPSKLQITKQQLFIRNVAYINV